MKFVSWDNALICVTLKYFWKFQPHSFTVFSNSHGIHQCAKYVIVTLISFFLALLLG